MRMPAGTGRSGAAAIGRENAAQCHPLDAAEDVRAATRCRRPAGVTSTSPDARYARRRDESGSRRTPISGHDLAGRGPEMRSAAQLRHGHADAPACLGGVRLTPHLARDHPVHEHAVRGAARSRPRGQYSSAWGASVSIDASRCSRPRAAFVADRAARRPRRGARQGQC